MDEGQSVIIHEPDVPPSALSESLLWSFPFRSMFDPIQWWFGLFSYENFPCEEDEIRALVCGMCWGLLHIITNCDFVSEILFKTFISKQVISLFNERMNGFLLSPLSHREWCNVLIDL